MRGGQRQKAVVEDQMGAVVEEVPVQRGEQQAVVEEVAVQRGGGSRY